MSKNVTIIGGGVIGLCCAYYLQKSGTQVTIIDRGEITDGTSFGNAGYVSPSHFIPLASPGIVAKGLGWMLSSSSPFYIKPRLDVDLIKWGLTFWKNANQETMERNMYPLNDFLQLSRHLTSEMKSGLGNHFRMEEIGCFMLYKNPSTEKHEIELAHKAKSFGIETRILNAREVQELEPEVEVKVAGGVLYPIDAHLHPGEFMKTLYQHLVNAGVIFRLRETVTTFRTDSTKSKVTGVETDKGEYDVDELVIANGSWLPLLTKELGIPLLLQAGKGYSITYKDMRNNLRYPAILVDNRVAMTPMGRDLRLGGTMEISGINNNVLVKRVQSIYNAAKSYYPGLEVEFPDQEKIWKGLRPLSPDGLPYIGRLSRYSNICIAGGHAMLGLSLAAGTGKLIKEIIQEEKTSIDITAFNPNRFN